MSTSPLVRPPSVFEGAVVVLCELEAVVDGLCGVDPPALADAETVVALSRQLERLTAVTTRAVAAFDAGRAWEADGARAASAWLAVRCRVPVSSARRRGELGGSLRPPPAGGGGGGGRGGGGGPRPAVCRGGAAGAAGGVG